MSKEAMKLEPCGGCYGSGWITRDPDIGTDQECFVCGGSGACPKEPAQQEPDWLDKEQAETDWDHVWLLIKAASYASSRGFISGTTNWGSAVSRYMRNESPQPAQPQQEPAQRTWVGLTDEQIEREWQFLHDEEGNPPDHHDFARAIEVKLLEKSA